MDKTTYGMFARGLRKAIAERGYKLGEFASGIMNPVTLSKNLSDSPYTMNERNRFACAKKLGLDIQEIIELGRPDKQTIVGDNNVQTTAGRDVTHNEKRSMTSQEEYFWQLFKRHGNADLLDEWIELLLGMRGE